MDPGFPPGSQLSAYTANASIVLLSLMIGRACGGVGVNIVSSLLPGLGRSAISLESSFPFLVSGSAGFAALLFCQVPWFCRAAGSARGGCSGQVFWFGGVFVPGRVCGFSMSLARTV